MKERPILFSAPMVRALLAGTKTQTRRAIEPQPSEHHWQHLPGYELRHVLADMADGAHGVRFFHTIPQNKEWDRDPWVKCPFYGQPGDRLWVREAFRTYATYDGESMGHMQERLACTDEQMRGAVPIQCEADSERRNWIVTSEQPGRYRHARFMPRWASRILVEVTAVRVERLQAISETDAGAEGVEPLDTDRCEREFDRKLCPQCGGTGLYTAYGPNMGAEPDTDCQRCDTLVKRYRWLWESINGPGSWDANQWVWVVEFRRVP